jgi:polyferredoxin
MKYILSWALPIAHAAIVVICLSRDIEEISAWYFSLPLGVLITFLTRDFMIDIYGTHITYTIKLHNKEDDDAGLN